MNDPNHTDHDRGLLDDLEAEYLEAAAAGDVLAIDYAHAESEEFVSSVLCTLRRLMVVAVPGCDPRTAGFMAMAAREDLVERLTRVAPLWAAAELPKRVAATEQMVAEWAQEVAAEPPEVAFDGPRRPARHAEVVFAAPTQEVA